MKGNKKSSQKRPAISDNFLEALRELPRDAGRGLAQDLIAEIPSEAAAQLGGQKGLSGEIKPGQEVRLEQKPQASPEASREMLRRQFHRETAGFARRERAVFTRREQETTLKIKALQQELKKLADATVEMDREVKIAALQQPVAPGVYHENFLERLLNFISHFRKRLSESASWLAIQNHRAKRSSYYWAQVGQSGTKFMLSQERYMATQAG